MKVLKAPCAAKAAMSPECPPPITRSSNVPVHYTAVVLIGQLYWYRKGLRNLALGRVEFDAHPDYRFVVVTFGALDFDIAYWLGVGGRYSSAFAISSDVLSFVKLLVMAC